MKLSSSLFLVALGLLTWTTGVGAQEKATPKKIVTIEGITEQRLDNGLRFLLFPDPSSSTVTVNMTVLVGSRHEGYGETGMAHLLEHMLFKGSLKYPDADKALTAHGAEANGTTWVDRTNYYETMPASDENLEFGIRFEADRLVNCFIKREDLALEMTVVRNEFEMGENNPEMILSQRMYAAAYEWHNYGKSTIGNRTDIERVPIDRLQSFYKKHYQPDNIVLTVAGKFDEAKALSLIATHFGVLPRPARKLEQTYTEEPAQDGERTVTLRRVGKVAVVGVLYHIPAASHDDHAACEVLARVLGATPTGRLYKLLVETRKATKVMAEATGWHDPGMVDITVRVSDGTMPAEVRNIIIHELENLAHKPVTDEEVNRAKKRYLAERERALTKSKSICLELSEWIGAGDWRLLFLYRDRVAKVTPDDVMRVSKKYLQTSNRTVGMFIPTNEVARTPVPPTPNIAKLVNEYKGGKALAEGESFDPTPDNIEKRVKRLTLSNGVKVALLQKKTRGEAVVGTLALHFGNEESLHGYETATSLLGPMMLRGTKKRSRAEIQDELDMLGAALSAGSGLGNVTFSWQTKRERLGDVLSLLHEVLREPTFPDKEFDTLQRNSKQQIEQAMVDPSRIASSLLGRKLHPYPKDHIYYRPSFEEALERLGKVTRDDVLRLYQEQLGGSQGEIVLVGDFNEVAVLKQLESLVAGWKSPMPYRRIEETANLKVPGGKETILTPDKEGATFVAGHLLALKDWHPDFAALEMGNYLLGGAPTARLFDRLRQKEGLCYGAYSGLSVSTLDDYGRFRMMAICNPENIDKVDKGALEEFNKILKKGVGADELTAGIKSYLQEMEVARGSDAGLAADLQDGLHVGRTFAYQRDLEKKIGTLTVDEVNRAVARYLDPKRLVIIRAGDFKK